MNNWQPIETAPKKERILLYDEFGHTWQAIWFEREKFWIGLHGNPVGNPTHWQPLPEPPQP